MLTKIRKVTTHMRKDIKSHICNANKYTPRSYVPNVHFVNSLMPINIQDSIKQGNISIFLLSDVPSIKDINNSLSFNFVETRFGTLAFTSKHNIESLKSYLNVDFHIVEVKNDEFLVHLLNNKGVGMVIYNAYCDLRTKSSYFLYFEVSN
jgi:hypothetical protein